MSIDQRFASTSPPGWRQGVLGGGRDGDGLPMEGVGRAAREGEEGEVMPTFGDPASLGAASAAAGVGLASPSTAASGAALGADGVGFAAASGAVAAATGSAAAAAAAGVAAGVDPPPPDLFAAALASSA
jgi:hypothetical protein